MVKFVAISMLFLSMISSHTLPILFVFQTAFSGHEQSRNRGRDRGKKRIPNIPKWIIRVERAVTDSTKSPQQPLIRMKEIPKRKRAMGDGRIKER